MRSLERTNQSEIGISIARKRGKGDLITDVPIIEVAMDDALGVQDLHRLSQLDAVAQALLYNQYTHQRSIGE